MTDPHADGTPDVPEFRPRGRNRSRAPKQSDPVDAPVEASATAPMNADAAANVDADASAPTRTAQRRPRISVIGVLGELFITAGALVLLFLGWQFVWNGAVASSQQSSAAAAQSKQWLADALKNAKPAPTPSVDPSAAPDAKPDYGEPPVMKAPAKAKPFAVMYAPRFGADWSRIIRESVDPEQVLNSYTAGVGHYPDTQMPGEVGNFAVAGHDTGWGNTFIDVSKLRIGDKIYLQTQDAWYTYSFRNYEYVQPDAINVLLPVPRAADATAGNRIMTITTCNPPYNAAERLIAYAVFDSWQPLSAGPPAEIAAQVAAQGGS